MSFNKNDFLADQGEVEYNVPSYANRRHCDQCYKERGNTVGITSYSAKAWFCSGFCSHLYFHEHGLAKYNPTIITELMKHRDHKLMITRRKQVLNF